MSSCRRCGRTMPRRRCSETRGTAMRLPHSHHTNLRGAPGSLLWGRPVPPRSAGFTLIELMVAMVVSAIVMVGIFAFSSIQRSTVTIHTRNVRIQQALEGAMWTLGQDVQQAGMGFARLCSELRVYD